MPTSCAALLALWLFVVFAGDRLLNQREMENLKLTADQQSWIVAKQVDDLMDRLRDIAGNAFTVNAFVDPLSVQHFLEPFLRSLRLGDFSSSIVAMVDFSGKVVASNQEDGVAKGELSEALWLDDVLGGEEALSILEGAMVAAVPIRVGSLPEGAIVIKLAPEDTKRLLSSKKHDGDVWLASREGRVLHGPSERAEWDQANELVMSDRVPLPGFSALEISSAVPARERDHAVGLLHRILFIAFVVDLAALVAGIYIAASLVSKPLNQLIGKIRSLQEPGDPGARLKVAGPRELENLALAFNDAVDRQADLTIRLEKSLAAEKATNEQQREFVSLVSHEFRTPLAIIDGNISRIRRKFGEIPPEQISAALEKCGRAVRRLIDLMESVLSSSRLEAGAIAFNPVPCRMDELLREIVQNQSEISQQHEIVADIDKLSAEVQGDPKLLHQIFTNLLSNAVKYSPNASRVWIEACSSDGEAVISVRDQGVGIPEKELEKLFGRFFRASTAKGIPGTGIGLHLVRNLVEMHGGEIAVTSVEDEGSTFTVRLPTVGARPRGLRAA